MLPTTLLLHSISAAALERSDVVPKSVLPSSDVAGIAHFVLQGKRLSHESIFLASQDSLHRAVRALSKRAMIVLTGPVADLDHGETIVIDGTVRRPIRGENALGVTRAFPSVHIDGIERSRGRSY